VRKIPKAEVEVRVLGSLGSICLKSGSTCGCIGWPISFHDLASLEIHKLRSNAWYVKVDHAHRNVETTKIVLNDGYVVKIDNADVNGCLRYRVSIGFRVPTKAVLYLHNSNFFIEVAQANRSIGPGRATTNNANIVIENVFGRIIIFFDDCNCPTDKTEGEEAPNESG